MDNLNNDIAKIREDFNRIIFYLENFSMDNFDQEISNINKLIKKIEIQRKVMQRKYLDWELKKHNENLDITIKEIVKKFDSIIEQKTLVQKEVSEELKKSLNEKKLINYSR